MKLALTIVFLAALSLPTLGLSRTLNEQWHSWKTRHEKVYVDRGEENVRRQIWIQNRARIAAHNRGNLSYSLALNQFADMVSLIYRVFMYMDYTIMHTYKTYYKTISLLPST